MRQVAFILASAVITVTVAACSLFTSLTQPAYTFVVTGNGTAIVSYPTDSNTNPVLGPSPGKTERVHLPWSHGVNAPPEGSWISLTAKPETSTITCQVREGGKTGKVLDEATAETDSFMPSTCKLTVGTSKVP